MIRRAARVLTGSMTRERLAVGGWRLAVVPGRAALLLLSALWLLVSACAPATTAASTSEREWTALSADYQWIRTLRDAQSKPQASAPRKEQIELVLANQKKLEPAYVAFVDKLRAYYERTGDRRAAALLASEKVVMGDQYMSILSRYDRAISLYREALELDPTNATAVERIAQAEGKRFVDMGAFGRVRQAMSEQEVRGLVGLPREDWIKQVVQNSRVYSVWIYPKADGGAAAIYFDNGVVYHTNWNAAAPPTAQ